MEIIRLRRQGKVAPVKSDMDFCDAWQDDSGWSRSFAPFREDERSMPAPKGNGPRGGTDRRRKLTCVVVVAVVGLVSNGCGSAEGTPEARIAGGSTKLAGDAASRESAPKIDLLHPVVVVNTSLGKITLRLDAENSPGAVRNFLNYVSAAHYDQTLFHYVESGVMVLGGGFNVDRAPKSASEPIRNEAHNGLRNKRGTISMSRDFALIDSATCQFFINLGDNDALDHRGSTAEEYGYCVFGEVTEGMDVADRIGQVPVVDRGDLVSTPSEPVVIQSVYLAR